MTFRTVFVIGTGRCGSTVVHEVLARNPDVAFLSNLEDRLGPAHLVSRWNQPVHAAFGHRLTRKGRPRFAPSEGYRALAREVSPLLVDPDRDLTAADATPWLAARTQAFFRRRAERQRRAVVLHKFTGWPRAGYLHAVFPDARFVHVVRDGREVAASWLTMPWWQGRRGPAGWGFGPLPDHYAREWEESGRSYVLLAGLAWKLLMDAYERARSSVPAAAWMDVRYEDFVREPAAVVARVCRFAGIRRDRRLEGSLGAHVAAGPSRVDAVLGAQRPLVERSLRSHLDAWGYE
ncbi:MAG: hypothetical protein KatS3mg009_0021 [Acidimicrobiia bacterium]|nr:MAG: hypothetical protein KatS3mg009_0021 [Acidimicrobiia bacterium]